jgi:hypothetical protein
MLSVSTNRFLAKIDQLVLTIHGVYVKFSCGVLGENGFSQIVNFRWIFHQKEVEIFLFLLKVLLFHSLLALNRKLIFSVHFTH